MIIFTNTFALSEAALDKARIGWRTHTRDAGVVATASTEAADGPKDAVLRPDTAEAWAPTAVPGWVKVDMGAAYDIDYVAVGGHNIGSAGATALVETSLNDSSYATFATDVAPADDSALMFLDTQRSARYARLTIDDAIARVGVIYIGLVLKMPRHVAPPYVPITMGRETVLTNVMSRGGHFLGQDFRRHGLTGSAKFRNLNAAWVRSDFDPFVRSARQYPYFFAWNPLNFPFEAGYCWTAEDIHPTYNGIVDLMDVDFNMRAHGSQ